MSRSTPSQTTTFIIDMVSTTSGCMHHDPYFSVAVRLYADSHIRGIEINVAIICACLPCLRALAGRFLPSLMSTHRSMHRGLDTIPVTERSRNTRSSGMVREHFEIIVNKAEGPSTMWLESRPSSGYMWAGKSALDLSDHGSEYDRESIGELQKPQQTWRPSQFRDGYV